MYQPMLLSPGGKLEGIEVPIAIAPELPQSDSEIDLTPMLDVVFIMLIFFIVTASFVREFGIDVNPPDTPTPAPAEGISVVIRENNEVWLENRLVDARALRPNFARLQAEKPGAAVVIQADKRSANKTLVTVMDASRAAGIYNIALAGGGE